jgi:imidazolonepropionase-like amidohydrolase
VRDAIADGSVEGPRLRVAVEMIGADDAGAGFRSRVVEALDAGADWIKLVGTIGVSAVAGQEIRSHFSEAEFRFAVDTAREAGARVLVHAWGGDAIDRAIEAGVASIEHGMYLTPVQAAKAAAAGLTFVPTLTIYRLVRAMVAAGELDGVPLDRLDEVLASHRAAVRTAYEAGLPLAIGSDFSTVEQHGTNLVEIAALMRAGVEPADALLAATRNGAALLGDADGGSIAPGLRADAVLLRSDPADPATFDDPHGVVGVIKDGAIVYLDPTAAAIHP